MSENELRDWLGGGPTVREMHHRPGPLGNPTREEAMARIAEMEREHEIWRKETGFQIERMVADDCKQIAELTREVAELRAVTETLTNPKCTDCLHTALQHEASGSDCDRPCTLCQCDFFDPDEDATNAAYARARGLLAANPDIAASLGLATKKPTALRAQYACNRVVCHLAGIHVTPCEPPDAQPKESTSDRPHPNGFDTHIREQKEIPSK